MNLWRAWVWRPSCFPSKNMNEDIMNSNAPTTQRSILSITKHELFYPLLLIRSVKNSKYDRFPLSSALKCAAMASSWRCKTATATSWLQIQIQRWRSGWPLWNKLYRAPQRPVRTGGMAQSRWTAAWVSQPLDDRFGRVSDNSTLVIFC